MTPRSSSQKDRLTPRSVSDLPILNRLGPLRRFAEIGIADYPRETRIRLAIINGVSVDTVMDPGRLVKRVVGGELPKN